MNTEQFCERMHKFGNCTQEELKAIVKDPNTKLLDLIFCRHILDSANGKPQARNTLYDRLWGKVKDQLEHSGGIDLERKKLENLSTGELIGIIKDFFGNEKK